jgi:hypothetical protein
MNSSIEPNGDFIEQWLDTRRNEGELDQHILGLVDKHRTSGELNEADLLKSLIALAETKSEDSNGSH